MTEKVKIIYSKYLTRQNIVITSLVFVLTLLSFLNLSLIFYNPPNQVQARADHSAYQIKFWRDFLALHPTYFEGWIEIANLHIDEDNISEAVNSYNQAFKINPNSEKLIVLQLKLGCNIRGDCD